MRCESVTVSHSVNTDTLTLSTLLCGVVVLFAALQLPAVSADGSTHITISPSLQPSARVPPTFIGLSFRSPEPATLNTTTFLNIVRETGFPVLRLRSTNPAALSILQASTSGCSLLPVLDLQPGANPVTLSSAVDAIRSYPVNVVAVELGDAPDLESGWPASYFTNFTTGDNGTYLGLFQQVAQGLSLQDEPLLAGPSLSGQLSPWTPEVQGRRVLASPNIRMAALTAQLDLSADASLGAVHAAVAAAARWVAVAKASRTPYRLTHMTSPYDGTAGTANGTDGPAAALWTLNMLLSMAAVGMAGVHLDGDSLCQAGACTGPNSLPQAKFYGMLAFQRAVEGDAWVTNMDVNQTGGMGKFVLRTSDNATTRVVVLNMNETQQAKVHIGITSSSTPPVASQIWLGPANTDPGTAAGVAFGGQQAWTTGILQGEFQQTLLQATANTTAGSDSYTYNFSLPAGYAVILQYPVPGELAALVPPPLAPLPPGMPGSPLQALDRSLQPNAAVIQIPGSLLLQRPTNVITYDSDAHTSSVMCPAGEWLTGFSGMAGTAVSRLIVTCSGGTTREFIAQDSAPTALDRPFNFRSSAGFNGVRGLDSFTQDGVRFAQVSFRTATTPATWTVPVLGGRDVIGGNVGWAFCNATTTFTGLQVISTGGVLSPLNLQCGGYSFHNFRRGVEQVALQNALANLLQSTVPGYSATAVTVSQVTAVDAGTLVQFAITGLTVGQLQPVDSALHSFTSPGVMQLAISQYLPQAQVLQVTINKPILPNQQTSRNTLTTVFGAVVGIWALLMFIVCAFIYFRRRFLREQADRADRIRSMQILHPDKPTNSKLGLPPVNLDALPAPPMIVLHNPDNGVVLATIPDLPDWQHELHRGLLAALHKSMPGAVAAVVAAAVPARSYLEMEVALEIRTNVGRFLGGPPRFLADAPPSHFRRTSLTTRSRAASVHEDEHADPHLQSVVVVADSSAHGPSSAQHACIGPLVTPSQVDAAAAAATAALMCRREAEELEAEVSNFAAATAATATAACAVPAVAAPHVVPIDAVAPAASAASAPNGCLTVDDALQQSQPRAFDDDSGRRISDQQQDSSAEVRTTPSEHQASAPTPPH